ncbi:ribosomal protein L6e-domain-containing protein [Fimicolochytrium jonesii]|uniref:ribosomal protein L6e-domain-containing protein n=1 Tax=Fimicolochytrium jonesii TaxID=1396493 RepID=UPI0022FE3C79|nr:ribosomal protein L6e-domain-containing protein [Fimicolochytrium jonesii]KAI8819172.1 ribosomal protein L6e-domain-containing protein [Fimicolochytrium jonesii]
MAHAPVNSAIVPGVSRFSRSASYAKKALFKKEKKTVAAKASAPASHKTVEVGGAKNGKSRNVPVAKASRWYLAEDAPVPKKSRKAPKPAKLRASITPGTVLIVLSGKYRGKRVVFLKQLETGLLLVTGPHKANGVPIRRVNQAYVIATSTKIDISGVNTEKFTDAYFNKEKDAKKGATEEALFDAKQKKATPASRVSDQKEVDKAILAVLKKDRVLKSYLNASFALSRGQFPHLLKF